MGTQLYQQRCQRCKAKWYSELEYSICDECGCCDNGCCLCDEGELVIAIPIDLTDEIKAIASQRGVRPTELIMEALQRFCLDE